MASRTVPFNYGLFWHAMIGLVGREPDKHRRLGWDGTYTFRYEPKDDAEKKKLAEHAATLQEWLGNFDLIPLQSRCEYGLLPQPEQNEAGKEYLDIRIVHPVEKKAADN